MVRFFEGSNNGIEGEEVTEPKITLITHFCRICIPKMLFSWANPQTSTPYEQHGKYKEL